MIEFEAQLRAVGMNAQASTQKAARLEELLDQLNALRGNGDGPRHGLFVPGRVEFLGKHTDYAGGRSIVCAIERGICMIAAPRSDAQIRMLDVKRESSANFVLSVDLEPDRGNWANFPMTVARRLAHDFPGARTGVDVVFASDLPRASGMSSSSALVVAVFFAIAQANALSCQHAYRQAICTQEDLAGYIAAIESGADFGAFSGSAGVGTHGGSEDHVAILCSGAGSLRQYSYCPVRFEREIPLPTELMFVIAVSGVKADKTGDARDAYNRASGATRRILDLWRTSASRRDVSLAAAIASEAGAAERIRMILRNSNDPEYSSTALSNRFEQFLRESEAIVPQAAQAIERHDFDRLGALVDESQSLAEGLLGNQVPETVELARSARELGAVAASAFGAGFGGSVWALVRSNEAPAFREAWAAKYHQRFPEREKTSEFFASRPGPGLIRFD